MKNQIEGLDRVLAFVERYRDMAITSTGAKVLNFSGGLYNVKSSTPDPNPSTAPYAVLYHTQHGWAFRDLAEQQASNLKSDFLHGLAGAQHGDYVLFERSGDSLPLHCIREINLPSAAP